MTDLIVRALLPGDSVRVGRRRCVEVSLSRPYFSNLHCVIDLSHTGSCGVCDHSHNGTWLMKSNTVGTESLCDDSVIKRCAVKLTRGVYENVSHGDCVLLLSPWHKDCMKFRFLLERGHKEREIILRQLPLTSSKLDVPKVVVGTKRQVNDADCSGPSKVLRLDNDSQHSVVKRRVHCTSIKGDISEELASSGVDYDNHSLSTHTGDRSSPHNPHTRNGSSSHSGEGSPSHNPHTGNGSSSHSGEGSPSHNPHTGNGSSSHSGNGSSSHSGEGSPSHSAHDPSSSSTVQKENCPVCFEVFPVLDLPSHCDDCTGRKVEAVSSDNCQEYCPHCHELFRLDELLTHCDHCPLSSSQPTLSRDPSKERCPICYEWFPVLEMFSHVDSCTSFREVEKDGGNPLSVTDRIYTLDAYERTASNLIGSEGTASNLIGSEGTASNLIGSERTPSNLIGSEGTASDMISSEGTTSNLVGSEGTASNVIGNVAKETTDAMTLADSASTDPSGDKEQCPHCLEIFALSALQSHALECSANVKTKCSIEEHCQHCLKVFPLDELVSHSLTCSQNKNLGSLECEVEVGGVVSGEEVWGEPVERCMHCFRDFPLSKLVAHSSKCKGEMLGPRDRFHGFLPSIHDMDPMAVSVLNDTQMAAVEYVMERSKFESESMYPELKKKVESLGYNERDLKTTLQWIRSDAPIIVHVNLDRVLKFLTEDTHYRNLFEVGRGGGSTDTSARASWEDRIFNKVYHHSPPEERVKYGVLNIVGDPRGVQSCYTYGDSFIQLKKVRLRTTFASADTSCGSVQLSCCEYYGNVLNQYSLPELQAILDVATRRSPFLQSNMITHYKEVQIHGPLCLSENVDCIVVNDRHASDTPTRELLDKFVERNKCNLLWMEPHSDVGYPTFTSTSHTHIMTTPLPSHAPPPAFPFHTAPAVVGPHPHRARRRRRRHGYHGDW